MNSTEEKDLSYYYTKGLIPGPQETKEKFYQRAQECLRALETFPSLFPELYSCSLSHPPDIWENTLAYSRKYYCFAPTWIPLIFSNYQLPFWQGGCAWIYQLNDSSSTNAFIQLRRNFQGQSNYLKIYSREELLTHELVHILRMEFNEPIFEEFLAYQTSSSAFRKKFAPIVQSSQESFFFLLAMIIALISQLLSVFYGLPVSVTGLFTTIPFLMIAYALIRLYRKHKTFQSCLTKMLILFGEKGREIIYLLTDQEIKQFSQISLDRMVDYIKNDRSLRWEMLKKYF